MNEKDVVDVMVDEAAPIASSPRFTTKQKVGVAVAVLATGLLGLAIFGGLKVYNKHKKKKAESETEESDKVIDA